MEQTMEDLFKQARAEKLWFYSVNDSVWLSPQELKIGQSAGRFCWGPAGWRLRDPHERLEQLEIIAKAAQRKLDDFRERIAQSER